MDNERLIENTSYNGFFLMVGENINGDFVDTNNQVYIFPYFTQL
ncbi:hypothetical protein [Chryseobacterium sp. RU37D]|nr:hypothetical protein [Chryseobacterium sp. RU37D]